MVKRTSRQADVNAGDREASGGEVSSNLPPNSVPAPASPRERCGGRSFRCLALKTSKRWMLLVLMMDVWIWMISFLESIVEELKKPTIWMCFEIYFYEIIQKLVEPLKTIILVCYLY